MKPVYLIEARRTAITRAGKEFSEIGAERLAAAAINAVLAGSSISPIAVDHVVLGNAAGPGGNIARVSVLASELPRSTPASSIDAQCASGLDALASAARMIAVGEAQAVIAGGTESSSTAPWRVTRPRDPMEPARQYSRARFTPAPAPDPEMGLAAENIARRSKISRERQDDFALQSHQRALAALKDGAFDAELVPVQSAQGLIDRDRCPRANLTKEKLAALRPVFSTNGTVTAGNCCPINDGAAAVLLVGQEMLEQLQPRFALRYLGTGYGACDPQVLGMAAVPAYQRLAKLCPGFFDSTPSLIEFNEAFAVQALACLDELGIDPSAVNLEGGAIALGHPYGASGAILATRLFWQAKRAGLHQQPVVALMAAAGGVGTALGFECLELSNSGS